MSLYRHGDRGPVVKEIRAKLARLGLLPAGTAEPGQDPAAVEHVFDARCDRAIRGFQQGRGLKVDGIVGPATYRALDEARWRLGDRLLSYAVTSPYVGDDVVELQQRMLDMGFDPGRCDGIFGRRTETAVREFQRNVGVVPDGTCGPTTLRALDRLARTVVGGHPQLMREAEQLHRAGPTLLGKVVVIDPGHGGADRGARGCGLDEASVVEDLAARVEGRLSAIGVRAYLTRGPDTGPTDAERAAFANDAGAHLLLSLHVDEGSSPHAAGVATYYYGHCSGAAARGPGSPVGERLAGLLQGELVARTGLADCRSHPKTWDLLRWTRMPAVRVELGYLTSPADSARLADADFRDTVAETVVVGMQRLYLPPESEVITGELRLPWVMAG